MNNLKKALVLVGHGGLPSDIPPEIVEKFMRVHKGRVKSGSPITEQELELDATIRKWDRSKKTDPYKYGLEALASNMKNFLTNFTIKTAYNEFCFPSIDQAVDELVNDGVSQIFLITTMITRGGSHSEKEIPEEVEALRLKYKDVHIEYAWPFNMDAFALFLSTHVQAFDSKSVVHTN